MRPLDLTQFPQPESNDSRSVEAALNGLHLAQSEAAADEAYDAFLWALGNSHAGTYYPVVLAVLPEIEEILVNGQAWAQRAAIESLIDLGGSFIPEEGHENYLGTSVQESLKTFIHSIRRHVVPLSEGSDACAKSAVELLELIDDQTV